MPSSTPQKNVTPKITCILSTYSDADHVEKKMKEILSQTIFSDAQFVFVETASPENEREIIKPYVEKHPNIHLISTDERKTLYEAWNMGWDWAQTDLLCYSNMDDVMHPKLLENVLEEFTTNPELDLCSVLIATQDEHSHGQPDSFAPKRLKRLRLARRPGPFSAWRNSLKEKIGQFDPVYQAIGDMIFWSVAVRESVNFRIIPKVLYLYTTSDGQLSDTANLQEDRDHARSSGLSLYWPDSIRKISERFRKRYRYLSFIYLAR